MQRALVREGKEILDNVGIDHINDMENLVLAPMGHGAHTTERVEESLKDLRQVVGNREGIIAVLRRHAEIAANSGR